MQNVKRFSALLILALLLTGCGILPERPAVETPTERLGEVYAGIAAAYATTADALDNRRLSSVAAAAVLGEVDEAREAADAAATALSLGEVDASERLHRAEQLLLAAERRLREEKADE